MNYVALIADSNGRYANIIVPATSWDHAIDQLEDIGCEVVECQSDDYEEDEPFYIVFLSCINGFLEDSFNF
jgi:hypothetical protein